MAGEEAAAPVFPEERPYLLAVRLREREFLQGRSIEKRERAFAMRRGKRVQPRENFE